jgi:molybdopterin-containing oxidoreductase family iron-sulfur binding subunit
MEKCTFCVQRVRRAETKIEGQEEGQLTDKSLAEGNFMPACVQACPTNTLVFGDLEDPDSQVSRLKDDPRHYKLLENMGTDPNVIYLKKIDPQREEDETHG